MPRLVLLLAAGCSETGVNKLDEKNRPGSGDDDVDSVNTAPEAEVVLRPMNPRTNDTVTAAAEASDIDGDSVTLTYAFTVDGSVVQDGPEATLSGIDHFNKGQTVRVIATATDIGPGMKVGASLPNQDLAGADLLTTEAFHSKSLGIAVAAILC